MGRSSGIFSSLADTSPGGKVLGSATTEVVGCSGTFNWERWRYTSNRGCCCYWYRFPKSKHVITQYVFRARKNTDIEFKYTYCLDCINSKHGPRGAGTSADCPCESGRGKSICIPADSNGCVADSGMVLETSGSGTFGLASWSSCEEQSLFLEGMWQGASLLPLMLVHLQALQHVVLLILQAGPHTIYHMRVAHLYLADCTQMGMDCS